MLAIPFRSWHLTELELGAEERTQFLRAGSDMFSALSDWQGPAWSLVGDRGRILGCFGMLVHGGTGVLWAVLSDEARANRFGLHRTARRQLALVERLVPTDRLLAAVRAGFGPGRRWLVHLGFTHDCDFELGNERYERYVKWAHQKQLSSAR
jgi:hypothetical protein